MSSWFMELYGGLQHDHIMRIIIYHTEPGLVSLIISNISPLVDCSHERLQKLYVDFITPTKLPNYYIVLCNIKILWNDIQTLLLNLLRYVTKTAVYLNVSAKFTSYSHHAVPSFCPFFNSLFFKSTTHNLTFKLENFLFATAFRCWYIPVSTFNLPNRFITTCERVP